MGGTSGLWLSRSASSTSGASALMVDASNRRRRLSSTPKDSLMRETTCVTNSECPPSSKKLSNTPTGLTLNTSAHIPANTSSTAVLGATKFSFASAPLA